MSTSYSAAMPLSSVRHYYLLMKPGIIYGNLLSAGSGFLLASRGGLDLSLLLATLLGTGLVIGCGCVYNNYIDRELDTKMVRTSKRALVTGEIAPQAAVLFGTLLGLTGFTILGMFTNNLTVLLGMVALVFYVVMYGVGKRRSVHGTLIGSISGAIPPVAGYTAVTGSLDTAALLLFLVLTFWQMPHFYAIAMYRRRDYAAAGLPVLPIVKGDAATKWQILMYLIAFAAVIVAFTLTGTTGLGFLLLMAPLCLWWGRAIISGFGAKDNAAWARRVFGSSLVVLLAFSIALPLGALLP